MNYNALSGAIIDNGQMGMAKKEELHLRRYFVTNDHCIICVHVCHVTRLGLTLNGNDCALDTCKLEETRQKLVCLAQIKPP